MAPMLPRTAASLRRRLIARFGTVLALAVSLATAPALGQARLPGGLFESGDEVVLLDLATMPSTYYRLDALGNAVPGIRLAQWANVSTRAFGDGQVRLQANFRFDLDTGVTPAEAAAVPMLEPTRFSLLSAWLDARVTDAISLRLGRQFKADTADYLAFDGVKIAVDLPWPMRLEVYGGVRASLGITQGAWASSLYELDGVASVDGTQPLAGVVLRSTGGFLTRREWSVGFRQTWRTSGDDRVLDAALPGGPYTTAQELMASAGRDVGPFHLSAGFAWELLLAQLMRAHASASVDVGDQLDVPLLDSLVTGLEYNRWQPTFALDSIWNYFGANAYDELGLTAVGRVNQLRVEGRVFGRLFRAQTHEGVLPLLSSPGWQSAVGGRVGVVLGQVTAVRDVFFQWHEGFGGRRLVLDGGWWQPLSDAFTGHLRVSFTHWRPDLRTTEDGSSFGLVGGLSWRHPSGVLVSVLLEETVNRFASPVPRVFAVLDFARWL